MAKDFFDKSLKIAVIGGGNIGTQFACKFASEGYSVNLFCSRADEYDIELEIIDENNEILHGKLNLVSSDFGEAVKGCDLVFVTHPAFMLAKTAEMLLPYVEPGMCICMIPGTGGAEFALRKCLKAGAVLYGLQRVPTVARIEIPGKRVRCEGLRSSLFVGAIPKKNTADFADFLAAVWKIPCVPLPNYLSVTLTPSNPILHTTRLRTLFADYHEGVVYDKNTLFYGEWSNASSELMIACDAELQEIIKKIDKMDLSYVKSLRIHYESNTVEEMTRKLRSIKSLHNLASPMIKLENGWIPDFNSRYFTADFPYGLAIIKNMADITGVDAPNITDTLEWYHRMVGDFMSLRLSDYGINTLDDIYELYHN